jgi:hypothetical protein
MYNCESEAAYKEESRFQVCLNHTPCKTLVEARKGQSSSVRVLKPAGLLFHDSCLSSKACGFISCGRAFFSLRLSAFDREIWRNLRRRGAVQGASVRTGKGLCPWGGGAVNVPATGTSTTQRDCSPFFLTAPSRSAAACAARRAADQSMGTSSSAARKSQGHGGEKEKRCHGAISRQREGKAAVAAFRKALVGAAS